MQKLAEEFIPVADEVGRLQRGNDPECRLFQKIAEQGHYAGRTHPTRTRQGIYMTSPGGVLLASLNTRDPLEVIAKLEEALVRWHEMPESKRVIDAAAKAGSALVVRSEDQYPREGLVLEVHSRDLPRENQVQDWRGQARNRDHAWFRKEEARQFLGSKFKIGDMHQVPEALVERLVRLHLIDNVRGESPPYPPQAIKAATLSTEVIAIEGTVVTIGIAGEVRLEQRGEWHTGKGNGIQATSRGYQGIFLGNARFDTEKMIFDRFEMLSIGDRWGATRYNARGDDLAGGPIGFLFLLAGIGVEDRVPPAYLREYRW